MTRASNGRKMRKFMDGRMTPIEAHRKFAWAGRVCTTCGGKPVLRIKTFMRAEDFAHMADPGVLAMIKAQCGNKIPTAPTKFGPICRIGDAFACAACRSDAEKSAARLPDYILVEFDRGPSDAPIMVGAGS